MSTNIAEKDYTSHTKHPINVHTGNFIIDHVSVYRFAWQVVVELAQNALDEMAQHIHIIIDGKRRILWAYDDGYGVSKEQIVDLWNQIGVSAKRDKPGKSGWKGIAKLANLAIALKNVFVSRPKKAHPGAPYYRIVVDKASFKDNANPDLDLFQLKVGFGAAVSFKPTTMVRLEDLQKGALTQLADPQAIADEIGKAFGSIIRQRNTDIQILYYPEGLKGPLVRAHARPKDYEGTKQDRKVIQTPYGPVNFEIVTSRSPVKKPELVIDYQNPGGGLWSFDLCQVPGILDKPDVKETLGSGYFQGSINLRFCTLVPDRQGFIDDEQRAAFVEAVRTYVYDWAKPYVAFMHSETNADREAKILKGEEDRLNELFARNPKLMLDGELRTFFPGGIPAVQPGVKPKKPVPSKAPAPKIEDVVRPPVKPISGGTKQAPPTPAQKPPRRPPRSTPTKNAEKHMGLRVVRKLANQEPRFSGPTWAKDGTIYFNVEHAFWIDAARKGDRPLAAYVHEHSCKEIAVMMAGIDERGRETFLEIFDEQFSRLTSLMRE